MYDVYSWPTSNGRKVDIMVEELGVDYTMHRIQISKGDQFTPAYTAINPNQKIPAIIDQDGAGGKPHTLVESGAILMYLAEKHGRFLPQDMVARYDVIQWLMFQMGGVGPMFGQDFHFRHQTADDAPPDAVAYGRERYGKEVFRLCDVLDYRLREFEFLAGPYTIADIAAFPWVALHGWLDIDLARFVGLKRWYERLKARPPVQRGMDVPGRETVG